jgi:hypothetical protein
MSEGTIEIQKNGQFDETDMHAHEIAQFIEENITAQIQAEKIRTLHGVKRYNPSTELIFSGNGDPGIRDGSSIPDKVHNVL